MAEYQKEIVKFDLNALHDKAGNINSSRPDLALPKDLESYLRSIGVKSLIWIEETERKLLKISKESESSFFTKMFSLLWFNVIRTNLKLTPKKLVWVLTHLDQLTLFIDNKVADDILLFLDKLAEEFYKRMK